jgi:arylsulfatase A-like enzyme
MHQQSENQRDSVTRGRFRLLEGNILLPDGALPAGITQNESIMKSTLRRPLGPLLPATVALGLALSQIATADVQKPSPARPNVVFILCDDLGYGDLGVFFQNQGDGGRVPEVRMLATPGLDRFAAEGMQLRGHYTGAPVCAPARASLLLGVHQGHANVRDNQFDKALEDHHTLGSVMQQAGYRTACIGKWGLQGDKQMPAHPMKRGFDEYFGYISHGAGHMHYPKEDRKALYDGMNEVAADYDKCYTTDLFTARAKKFIISQARERREQPFFLYLAYDTPHAKTQIPSCEYPAGAGLNGGLQWLGSAGKMINTAVGNPDSWFYPEHEKATWNDPGRPGNAQPWPVVAKRYATMVRRIDDCVSDLVLTLRDLGIERETLVIFTSDNGPSKESYLKGRDANNYSKSFDPQFFRGYGPFDGIKRDCYEGGVRVGALARWPGTIPAGKVSLRASQFHDWMPTLCQAAGMPAPARTDGVSLLPELMGAAERPASTIYVEYFNGTKTPAYQDFLASRRKGSRGQMQMIRSGDLVGVRHDIGSHEDDFEIYDVVKDPGQRRNLAAGMTGLQQWMKDRVLRIRRPEASAPRVYMDSLPIPAASPPGRILPGLDARMLPIDVPWPVSEDGLAGIVPTVVTSPQSPPGEIESRHGLVFQGWLRIPHEGEYEFSLPDGCKGILKLHGATALDADRGTGAGKVRLAEGMHPILLSVVMDGKSPSPVLSWSASGKDREAVPAEYFVRTAE